MRVRRSRLALAWRFLLGGLAAIAGCSVPVLQPSQPVSVLAETYLSSPVVDICVDGKSVLALDVGGGRLLRFTPELLPVDTVVLPQRVVNARGCASDRAYFYLWNDHNLYRLQRAADSLALWLGNVRLAGIASYGVGEALVADAQQGAVFLKTVFGASRRFLPAADLPRPGPMAALSSDEFCALSGTTRLVFFNRTGAVLREMKLPTSCNLLATANGNIYVARSGAGEVFRLAGGKFLRILLPEGVRPERIVAIEDRLIVLTAGWRLVALSAR